MKYKDLTVEEAREECKKHILRKDHNGVLVDCDHCPLRRTRIDDKGKERTLFCFFKLRDLIANLIDDYDEMEKEEVKYYKERKDQA